jgi:hypothetical protein
LMRATLADERVSSPIVWLSVIDAMSVPRGARPLL